LAEHAWSSFLTLIENQKEILANWAQFHLLAKLRDTQRGDDQKIFQMKMRNEKEC